MALNGFFSYVHDDDGAEGGRITTLAADIARQYEMLTGEAIEVFTDISSLVWGDDWRRKIDESLTVTAFFIPVLTPRYFQSTECRRELSRFAHSALDLSVSELVLPILYVPVPDLTENSEDEAKRLVSRFHWQDWTETRFSTLDSEEYRRAVSGLAGRIAEANRAAETTARSQTEILVVEASGELHDKEDGLLDELAAMETAMPRMTAALVGVSDVMERATQITTKWSARMDRADRGGGGTAAKLTAANGLARDLEKPADELSAHADEFTTALATVDRGMHLLLESIPGELESGATTREEVDVAVTAIQQLAEQSNEAFRAFRELVDTMAPTEGLSRSLRPAVRKMRQGLMLLSDGRETIESWLRLVDGIPPAES